MEVSAPTIFDDIITALTGAEAAFNAFAENLLSNQQFTDWLVAFNLDDMYEGIRPDGTKIEKTPLPWQHSNRYEASTIAEKKVKGQVYNRVTLKDTGEFYDSVTANVTGSQQICIQSNDPKADKLIATWGLVLGASEQNLEQFIEILRPEFFTFAETYFSQ